MAIQNTRAGEYVWRSAAIWITSVALAALPVALVFTKESTYFLEFIQVFLMTIIGSAMFGFPALPLLVLVFYLVQKMNISTLNKRSALCIAGGVISITTIALAQTALGDYIDVMQVWPFYVVSAIVSVMIWTHKYDGNPQNQEV